MRFAHGLVRAGVDVVHGHSSHRVRPLEVFEGRLVLDGCGDFLDDYEGIADHDLFRSDLGLTYFVAIDPVTGRLADLRMVPTRVRRFRIERAPIEDARWLRDTINRESRRFGLRWPSQTTGAWCRSRHVPIPAREAEIRRRQELFRGGRPRVAIAGRTVIVVDDGVATGGTIRAALRGVQRAGPRRVVLAVGVAPPDVADVLRREVDDFACIATPHDFGSVGQFYRDFRQVTDDEVVSILARAEPERRSGPADRRARRSGDTGDTR